MINTSLNTDLIRLNNARITFDIAVLDRLSQFAKKEPEDMYKIAKKVIPMANEHFILKTCNRIELYCTAPIKISTEAFKEFFTELAHPIPCDELDLDQLMRVSYDDSAITQLFRVAAGIESMVIGENEILGQIKRALELARNFNDIKTLDQYIVSALKCGKKIRANTNISKGNISVGSLALDFVLKQTDRTNNNRILVIGAGEIAQLVLKHLRSHSHGSLYVCNRTHHKAIDLASQFEGVAIKWDQLNNILNEIDILVCASGALDFVITEPMIRTACKNKMTIIDLGTPPNVAPEVNKVPNVEIINMDTLKEISQRNLQQRQSEISRIIQLLDEEIELTKKRMGIFCIEPLITSIYQKANQIRENELKRMYIELKNRSERDQKEIMEQFSQVLVKKVLHDFVTSMRDAGLSHDMQTIESLHKAFHSQSEISNESSILNQSNPVVKIPSPKSGD